jgi:hypothetical protein
MFGNASLERLKGLINSWLAASPPAPAAHASTHEAAGSDPVTISESQVTNLTSDLSTLSSDVSAASADAAAALAAAAGAVQTTRAINTTGALSGGGDLSADRTLSVTTGTTAGTVCAGNDSRLSDARTPTAHTHPISTGITGLGTGVATALAVNVGSAGAPVVNGGALGTPSSGDLTNCTGLPVAGGGTGGTIGAPSYAYRTTNGTDKNQDINFADDGVLQFPVSANKDYIARFVIRAQSNGTAKLKYQLTGPASPTLILYHSYSANDLAAGGVINANGTPYATAFSTSQNASFGTTNDTIFIEMFLRNGANAGTVKLQYAQAVSTNVTTRTLPGSVVTWQQLN